MTGNWKYESREKVNQAIKEGNYKKKANGKDEMKLNPFDLDYKGGHNGREEVSIKVKDPVG